MTWPTNPIDISDIPQLEIEDPFMDPSLHLTPQMKAAVCRTVIDVHPTLEDLTRGDEWAEAVVGSALVAAVQRGEAMTDLGATQDAAISVRAGFGSLLDEALPQHDAAEVNLFQALSLATVQGWSAKYRTRT